MTQHDPWLRVRHMYDHAQEAIDMLGTTTHEQLIADRTLQLAVVQLVEIVGEAANQVDASIQEAHPDVPWRLSAGMRHRLIHGYDVIDYEIVFKTVTYDFPVLIKQLQEILPEEN